MTKIGENPVRLPARFYKSAAAQEDRGVHLLLLDGRAAKTRAGAPLSMRSPALASAVADEWNAQLEHVNFTEMPMTRFAMTVADHGHSDSARWRKTILSFLGSDLLCYRAVEPAALVERQNAAWDPVLDWAARDLGVRLIARTGIGYIQQPEAALTAGDDFLAALAPEILLGAKEAAEISGSAAIALALVRQAFPADRLFEISRVDEAFQAERWGADAEADERQARLKRDFLDAARFISLA